MSEQPISELAFVIAGWAISRGAENLAAKPGVWSDTCGEFVVSINPHNDKRFDPEGMELPPYHMSVHAPKYLGSSILLTAFGGIGAAGMEADVIDALREDMGQ